jgi:hypothetical protein
VGRRVVWILLLVSVVVAGLGVWLAFQVRGQATRQAPRPAAGVAGVQKPRPQQPRAREQQARDALFAELQPVKLANCELARFGEHNDGGYLLCKNLVSHAKSAYSYGISGYDGWGCQVATGLKIPVHQYDCFDTRHPSCPTGKTVFHPECIAGNRFTDPDGRLFDSMESQLAKNGDAGKHVIVKMDVEGAEWDSILKTPDAVLEKIDQMIFELHGVDYANISRSFEVVLKLKKHFHIAHLHINNFSCASEFPPFPGWAYEVTFVSKRLAQADPRGTVTLPHPLDTPNNPLAPDCPARSPAR